MKKIIKATELGQRVEFERVIAPIVPRGGIISKAELTAGERAQQLLEEAKAQALRIKAEAEKILIHVKEEMERAKQKGYQDGKEEGLAELAREIFKLRELKEKFFGSAEAEVIKLVMEIAEKVIGKLVEEHKETVRSIVRQALERSLGDRIVVRLHPEDFKHFSTEELQFKDLVDRTKQLHFKEDETIQKGGCVVETEVGTIDAQLETQLKAIRKALGI